jgi:hypothetical protein
MDRTKHEWMPVRRGHEWKSGTLTIYRYQWPSGRIGFIVADQNATRMLDERDSFSEAALVAEELGMVEEMK